MCNTCSTHVIHINHHTCIASVIRGQITLIVAACMKLAHGWLVIVYEAEYVMF